MFSFFLLFDIHLTLLLARKGISAYVAIHIPCKEKSPFQGKSRGHVYNN